MQLTKKKNGRRRLSTENLPVQPPICDTKKRQKKQRTIPWYDKDARRALLRKKILRETSDASKLPDPIKQLISKLTPSPVKVVLTDVMKDCNSSVATKLHRSPSLILTDYPHLLDDPEQLELRQESYSKSTLRRGDVDLEVGHQVWAKHKNGRYYRGRVISVDLATSYRAYFAADNTICNDLQDINILDRNANDPLPQKDQQIRVRWSDGVIYDGRFLGTNRSTCYKVSTFRSATTEMTKEKSSH